MIGLMIITLVQHNIFYGNNIQGLQCTTLQYTQTYDVQGSREFVQCLHVFDNHWISISTVKCPSNVYDSLNLRLSISTKKIVAVLLQTKNNFITIEYVNIKFQSGHSDCGLFVIANATAICNGMDPAYLEFKQGLMREHLKNAFDKKFLTPFPAKKIKQKLLVQKEKVHIFCMCRTIDDGRCMVECSKCQKWYHAECVTISNKTIHDENESWFCQSCTKFLYTYDQVAKEIKLLHP